MNETLAPEIQIGPAPEYFSAADIARAISTPTRKFHKKTIARTAQREQWPSKFDGYRWTYAPPRDIADVIVSRPASEDVAAPAPAVTFADLVHDEAQREKVLRREAAVKLLEQYLCSGREVALETVVATFRATYADFDISVSSLRRWEERYQANGIDGLVEQKRGVVGRKAFVNDLEEHHLLKLAADATGHGNWKRHNPRARLNKAAAFRNLAADPTVTGPARSWLHGGRASKSAMPPSVSRAIDERISPLGATLIQVGAKAAKLDGAYNECSYDNVPAGEAFTADDMTANCYVWSEWPNEQGFILIRPQILAAMDIGSMSWLNIRAVMRPKGQYTKDDVWGLIGDIFDDFGLFKRAVLEGGIWQSNIIKGQRTDIGHKTGVDDETRFGGLRSLGVQLIHTRTPRAKIIETGFNHLQHAADNVRGFCGRDERKDCPEETKRNLALVRAGHAHPRQFFLHINEYSTHLQGVMNQLNNERGDGKILRGLCPADKWQQDAPQFDVVPAESKWMYRSDFRVIAVTKNGVRITVGTGKYQNAYSYSAPELENHRGRRVFVFWNDYDPDTDAVIYSIKSGKPDKMICVAARVAELPRFGANPEDLRAAAARKKLQMNVAVTQKRSLAPYLQRNFKTVAAQQKAAEIGEQIHAVRVKAGEKAARTRRVRTIVTENAGDLSDLQIESPREVTPGDRETISLDELKEL